MPGASQLWRGAAGSQPQQPTFLAQLMVFLISSISSVSCGHLDKLAPDTGTLNACSYSDTASFLTACATLITQTFKSLNLKPTGVLQQSQLFLLLYCSLCWMLSLDIQRTCCSTGRTWPCLGLQTPAL